MDPPKGLHAFFTRRDNFVLSTSLWPANERTLLREATVRQLLVDAATHHPHQLALVAPDGNRRWTYAELLDDVHRVAATLLEEFDPGQGIVLDPDTPDRAHVVRLACAVAGLPLIQGGSDDALTVDSADVHARAAQTTAQPQALPQIGPEHPVTTSAGGEIVLTHRALVNCGLLVAERLAAGPSDVWLADPAADNGPALPGLEVLATCGTYIPASPAAVDLTGLITAQRVSILDAVPPDLLAVKDRPLASGSALRVVISRAPRMSPEVAAYVETDLAAELATVFGVPGVTAAMCASYSEDSLDDRIHTVGRPLAHTAVLVAGPDDATPLPCGTEGRVLTRGIGAMTGDGDWIDTGRRGSMDTRGHLTIASDI